MTPSIDTAMATIADMSAFYKQRSLEPPSEAEVMQLLNAAHARGLTLTDAQWTQAFQLGRQRCISACQRLRTPAGDIDDETWAVVNLFHPEKAYDPMLGRQQD